MNEGSVYAYMKGLSARERTIRRSRREEGGRGWKDKERERHGTEGKVREGIH